MGRALEQGVSCLSAKGNTAPQKPEPAAKQPFREAKRPKPAARCRLDRGSSCGPVRTRDQVKKFLAIAGVLYQLMVYVVQSVIQVLPHPMTRFVSRHVPIEMAALWVGELLLSVGVFLIALGGVSAPLVPLGAPLPWAAALAVLLGGSGVVLGLYRTDSLLDRRLVLNAALAAVLAFPVALLVGGRIAGGSVGANLSGRYALSLVLLLLLWFTVTVATRYALRLPFARRLFVHRVLLVGPGATALRVILDSQPTHRFAYQSLPPGAEAAAPSDGSSARHGAPWGVLLANSAVPRAPTPDPTPLSPELRRYRRQGVRIFDRSSFFEHCLGRADLAFLTDSWFISGGGFVETRFQAAAKRALDVAASLFLLVLTFPLMLLVALAVSFDSPGPVLYRQQRVGRYGQVFTLLKFRSMRADAERGGTPVWAAKGDDRVTSIGRIIRATRIDELPQLFNVLRGEMSLVGPRPERPHFVEQLAEIIPFYRERSLAKPGITGWAQVNYPYGASVEDAREKLAYDLYYIKHRGLLLDLLVLLSTVRVILLREGAR